MQIPESQGLCVELLRIFTSHSLLLARELKLYLFLLTELHSKRQLHVQSVYEI